MVEGFYKEFERASFLVGIVGIREKMERTVELLVWWWRLGFQK